MKTSKGVLKGLAAAVWLLGGFVLLLKGHSLIREAVNISPGDVWPWLGYPGGLLLGGWKGLTVFSRRCRKNLARIEDLEHPRWWQFYSPWFFVALAAMIATGAALSRLAHGHYLALIAVGSVDIALATALFLSSSHYIQLLTFAQQD